MNGLDAQPDDLTTVHLLELPVALAGQARQWFEELVREFALMHASTGDASSREVPARLMAMVDALTTRFAGFNDDARNRLDAAIDRRDLVIADHVMLLPPDAAAASQGLSAMMDEADEFCRQGQHLLTLAEPDEVRTYRQWFLDEVVRQLAGGPPTSWPQYMNSR